MTPTPTPRQMLDDLTREGLTHDQYQLCERCEVCLDRGLGNAADLNKLELLWKEKRKMT